MTIAGLIRGETLVMSKPGESPRQSCRIARTEILEANGTKKKSSIADSLIAVMCGGKEWLGGHTILLDSFRNASNDIGDNLG